MTDATVVPIRPIIVIDPEISNLCRGLTAEERDQLEANIKADGCRDALTLWGEILLDGHNRHEICQRLRLSFRTEQVGAAVTDREQAINWVIDNQLGRRNLNPEEASYLRGKVRVSTVPSAKERGARGGRPAKSSGQIDPSFPDTEKVPMNTAQVLADRFGVSEKTIKRDAAFAASVDSIAANVGRDVATEIRTGKSDLTREQVAKIGKAPPAKQREAVAEAKEEAKARGSERTLRARLADEFGNGKWYPIDEIAEHFDRPIKAMQSSLNHLISEWQAPKFKVERKQVGPTYHYKIFRSAKGMDRMISSAELEQKLRPIIKALKELGTKNSVTIDIAWVNECAVDLKNALDSWTK